MLLHHFFVHVRLSRNEDIGLAGLSSSGTQGRKTFNREDSRVRNGLSARVARKAWVPKKSTNLVNGTDRSGNVKENLAFTSVGQFGWTVWIATAIPVRHFDFRKLYT